MAGHKTKREPGTFWHVINVTFHKHRIQCIVGIDMNLRKSDQVLRRGNIEDPPHQNSYVATQVFEL